MFRIRRNTPARSRKKRLGFCAAVIVGSMLLLPGCSNILTPKEEMEAHAAAEEAYRLRSESYEQISENPVQFVQTYGLPHGVELSVRVDKTTYEYHEFVYVSAILMNQGTEPLTLWMPTQTRNIHQELPTVITNGEDTLLDVDMYVYSIETSILDVSSEPGTLTLEPGERYLQTMCFSPYVWSDYGGRKIMLTQRPASGEYHGTVTAYIMEDGEPVPHTAEFDITIEPDLGHQYDHW